MAGLDRQGRRRRRGLGNVDARLRQVYGDDFGLVVETASGAGTKVTFRVPKYAPAAPHVESDHGWRPPATVTSARMSPRQRAAVPSLRALVVDDEAQLARSSAGCCGSDDRIAEVRTAAQRGRGAAGARGRRRRRRLLRHLDARPGRDGPGAGHRQVQPSGRRSSS